MELFKSFLKHIFPLYIKKKDLTFFYTICLGGIALTAFLTLLLTGAFLLIYYIPAPTEAYNSVLFIEREVFGGRFLRSLHRMSCHLLLIFIFLHTLRVIFTGVFLTRRYNWVIGMLLLLFIICSAYTGYLLPMDQLSYWATQTGMELISFMPFGDAVKSILAPDGIGGKLTLIRFYALHVVIIPLITASLIVIHFYRIRKDKGVLPYL